MHTMTISNDEPKKIPAGKLVFGLVLLVIGGLMFLDTIDVFEIGPLWSWWPLILIAIGGANELDAIRNRKSDGSFILLAIGVWMLAATRDVFGLSVGGAMPIGLIVVGLFVLLHAIIDVPVPEKKENEHERQ